MREDATYSKTRHDHVASMVMSVSYSYYGILPILPEGGELDERDQD